MEKSNHNFLLSRWGHPPLLNHSVAQEIRTINLDLLAKQQKVLKNLPLQPLGIHPVNTYRYVDETSCPTLGEKLLNQGAVGCLIVAGGQGSRAGFSQPKALFPISNVKHKSFLQIFCEKTLAASKLGGKALPLAIMTSSQNHDEIHRFLIQNNYFGLEENQVDLFKQGSLPFLDETGQIFLSNENHIAMGPNGNGCALKEFINQGIWKKWHQKGINVVSFVMIDNPLAEPFDLHLIHEHVTSKVEITWKCVLRESPEEKVGLIAKKGTHLTIAEYSEVPEATAKRLDLYPLANISLFMINMETIISLNDQELPLHAALKKTQKYSQKAKMSKPTMAWKFEYFIFDILNFSDHVSLLVYPRSSCFAPVKSSNDVTFAQAMLLARDREVFSRVTGCAPPDHHFELDPQFYYPTRELKRHWQGKQAPSLPYISGCDCAL
ncbi:MAG: UTP--glucose-1-phosphate uridylyltransferase [Parachlamydiaceae bacterium]